MEENMKKYTIVIAGGGSTFTPGVVKALLSKKNEFKLKELRVYDIDLYHLCSYKETDKQFSNTYCNETSK